MDDESFALFCEDLDDTPTAFFEGTVTALQSGSCSFEALCPRSLRYFERLVGVYGNQGTIDDYLAEVIIPQGKRILRWPPQRGLRLLLLLGARPQISTAIGELSLNTKDLAATLDYLTAEGDLLSQVTAIEIAFGLAERSAAIRQPLARLVRSYVSREDGEQTERHELFSALVKFVLTATSRYRTLSANPPYWRRLAALAHAALLERCILRLSLDRRAFTEGIATFSTTAFQAQSWADLRLEPRGMPVLLEAHQLKIEFTYRILAAADKYPEAVKLCDLEDSLGSESAFRATRRPLFEALPGPVEGGVEPVLEPPDDFRATALSNFAGEKSGVLSSSLPLMLVLKIPPDLPIAAAEALDQLAYRLPPMEDTLLLGRLLGWCVVAAVTRNEQLRDALSKLIRVHFACNPGDVTFAASLQMTLTSSAASLALGDWCKHIGSFFDWVAFHPDLSADEAVGLLSFLRQLTHVVPELWQTCGRAEAALQVLAEPSRP